MPGDHDEVRVVTMPAELDLASAARVRAALLQALDGARVLVADMAAVRWCTLEGVHALLQACAAAARAGAQLRLAAASPAIRRVLERTGATQVLRLYPSLEEARSDPAAGRGQGADVAGGGSSGHGAGRPAAEPEGR